MRPAHPPSSGVPGWQTCLPQCTRCAGQPLWRWGTGGRAAQTECRAHSSWAACGSASTQPSWPVHVHAAPPSAALAGHAHNPTGQCSSLYSLVGGGEALHAFAVVESDAQMRVWGFKENVCMEIHAERMNFQTCMGSAYSQALLPPAQKLLSVCILLSIIKNGSCIRTGLCAGPHLPQSGWLTCSHLYCLLPFLLQPAAGNT